MVTEKRLIDANALIADIQGTASEVCMKSPFDAEWFTRLHDRQREIIATIERQPQVDAAPVVHGRWIFKHNPIEDPKGYFIRIVCSECNLHTGQKSNYCPNCGAKMRG